MELSVKQWVWLLGGLLLPLSLFAEPSSGPKPWDEPVIEPQLARPQIIDPNIDALDFELGLYAGLLNVDKFGTQPLYGVRLSFYVTEDFFLDGSYGVSTVKDSSYRRVGLVIFPSEEQQLDYYQLALGYNLLPGEAFIGSQWAWNSALYLLVGAGNVHFVDQDYFSYGVGFGYRAVPMERLNLRLDLRDQLFESDLLGVKELTHNIEVTLGASFFF